MIKHQIEDPSSLFGYRAMWNKLQCCCPSRHGHGLQELDLQASIRKLLCRSFISRGPNAAWHVDGYDKVKPYGLPIHDCVDELSRRILWLKVCKSNNYPVIQASFFNAVEKRRLQPMLVLTYCGLTALECLLSGETVAYRCPFSHANRHI